MENTNPWAITRYKLDKVIKQFKEQGPIEPLHDLVGEMCNLINVLPHDKSRRDFDDMDHAMRCVDVLSTIHAISTEGLIVLKKLYHPKHKSKKEEAYHDPAKQ